MGEGGVEDVAERVDVGGGVSERQVQLGPHWIEEDAAFDESEQGGAGEEAICQEPGIMVDDGLGGESDLGDGAVAENLCGEGGLGEGLGETGAELGSELMKAGVGARSVEDVEGGEGGGG